MDGTPAQQAALGQLADIPGVVGSMVFDRSGAVAVAAFPGVFDLAGLRQLATKLASDGYFQEWMTGEQAALELRYTDGTVLIRALGEAWLLVLCTLQSNAQLVAMSLTQVVRRLRIQTPPPVARAPAHPPPTTVDRLRSVVTAELGEHSAQALEILAAAGAKPKDLLRAVAEIEKLVRLFISKKKAEEIGSKMREILDN
jgi:predicted regulator of Ras-like GTPase activity (Roadblock/LC7/MglB family)